jgi:ABC-type antimicrobial peptide transport system permease subunit
MLRNFFLITLRNGRSNPLYTAINLSGLAIGLACCMSIGLFIRDETSYDRFQRDYQHIYRVVQTQKQADGVFQIASSPDPLAAQLKKDFREVEEASGFRHTNGLLILGDKAAEIKDVLLTDSNFFIFFSFPLLIGDKSSVFARPNRIVLSAATAEAFFGADWRHKATPGKTFSFNNDLYSLGGVAENAPGRSSINFDILLYSPYRYSFDDWGSNDRFTFVRLKPGTPIPAFNEKIKPILHRMMPVITATVYLQAFKDIYLYSKFDWGTDWGKRSDILYVRVFAAVGFIILFIAIVNFVNLSTARAANRAKEVGIRKTVGAKRGILIGQFLTESLLLTAFAVLLGLLLLFPLLSDLNSISGKTLRIPFAQPGFWITIAALTGFVGCISGIYPAFYLSSFRPVKVLRGAKLINARSGRFFWQSLVVGQFALSVILGISAAVVARQLHYIQNKKLGFDKSQLLYVQLKGDARPHGPSLKQDLLSLPGVWGVSGSSGVITDDMNSTTNISWEGQKPGDRFLVTQMNVDADFFQTMGITLDRGRNFLPRPERDTSNGLIEYIVNESAATRMGYTGATAIGKKVNQRGMPGFVVGVVRDFHFRPLQVAISPFIFRCVPSSRESWQRLYARVRPGQMPAVLDRLGEIYKKYDPLYSMNFGFVDQDLDALYRPEQITGKITTAFSLLAIFVSCLGLFGLATFTLGQRTKEIGIRKVLGAPVIHILTLLSGDFVKLVLLALVIAIPIAAWGTQRWLQEFTYRTPVEWWIFGAVGSIAIGLALVTVGFKSLRAAILPAIKSLREE